jgi:hypothetical protein
MSALDALEMLYGSRLWALSHEQREAVTRDLVSLAVEESLGMEAAAAELHRRIGGYLES